MPAHPEAARASRHPASSIRSAGNEVCFIFHWYCSISCVCSLHLFPIVLHSLVVLTSLLNETLTGYKQLYLMQLTIHTMCELKPKNLPQVLEQNRIANSRVLNQRYLTPRHESRNRANGLVGCSPILWVGLEVMPPVINTFQVLPDLVVVYSWQTPQLSVANLIITCTPNK